MTGESLLGSIMIQCRITTWVQIGDFAAFARANGSGGVGSREAHETQIAQAAIRDTCAPLVWVC